MRVTEIFRHPIKSFGWERLNAAALSAGAAMPHDRIYAITHGASAPEASSGAWARCHEFARVTNAPKLAALQIAFDPETDVIEAAHPEAAPLRAELSTEAGRRALADWAAPLMAPAVKGPFAIIRADERVALTDADGPYISVHSHASRRAIEAAAGGPLDLRRFRANFWIDAEDGADALTPFAEHAWAGREATLGAARIRFVEPISRCAATAANPETGARDRRVTPALDTLTGDRAFGVLAEVLTPGLVREGAALRLL